MFVKKTYSAYSMLRFTWFHLVWLALLGSVAVVLYEYAEFHWLAIPWLPISLVGTAVAFYLGFKNNSSYDRMWEARKIWGEIVNTSRAWGSMISHFANNQTRDRDLSGMELHEIHERMVYRHIAWLYTLRSQLLKPTEWEHLSTKMTKKLTEKRISNTIGRFSFPDVEVLQDQFLASSEAEKIRGAANSATQLIHAQSADLALLRKDQLLDDFRHMELQKLLGKFYDQQGKCERIKKFPLPRQYASASYYMVVIFIGLLPFGMLQIFAEMASVWITVPFTMIVGWVFVVMELVGDYSENPFERLLNDIPMFSLCRTIEIDLREMLGEKDLPPQIESKDGALM